MGTERRRKDGIKLTKIHSFIPQTPIMCQALRNVPELETRIKQSPGPSRVLAWLQRQMMTTACAHNGMCEGLYRGIMAAPMGYLTLSGESGKGVGRLVGVHQSRNKKHRERVCVQIYRAV